MCRYRVNQHLVILELDSVSNNKTLETCYCASFTESKFDVKFVNAVKSTTW